MKCLTILVAGAVLLCTAYAQADAVQPCDSIGSTKLNGKLHLRYLVSPGETVYGISTRYHVAVTDLLETNPELEGGLKVGQVILIPYDPLLKNSTAITPQPVVAISPSLSDSEKRVVHKVQAGETLYSLAKKYNVTVDELLKWNNMELREGQEVVINVKSVTTRSSPSSGLSEKNLATSVALKPTTVAIPPLSAFALPDSIARYHYDPSMQQVLIIPFDPYLYFSDADDEIAARSNIARPKVRQVIRRRLNALLDHPGYENIHLLGGKAIDSLSDLNKIYGSVTYNYQEILYNPNYVPVKQQDLPQAKKTNKSWIDKQKEKMSPEASSHKAVTAKDNGKYFGVILKNPALLEYFNAKYNIDYYVFINQFEVKTNYENCLDRAALNYERTFTTHFSIFDATGKQIAGNKFPTHYNSNSNNIDQIAADNMQKIADRVVAELPLPKRP